MKTTFLVIALIGCVALGILGVEQSKKLKVQSDELAKANQQLQNLQAELNQKAEEIANAKVSEAKASILQKTLSESATAVAAESKKSAALKQSLDESKTNNPLHAMASMFKDPKMREMMKSQQKTVIGPMIDKQYSELFKQLKMTPEQAANFKDLVSKKMLTGADMGLSMLDDSMDASQRADLAKQVKAQNDDYDQQIKQSLGDDNYKAYQAYEKTIPDRTSVSQFSDEFAGTATALSAGQQEQMIQAMGDARNNFNWTSGLNKENPGANGDIVSMLTQENIDKFVAEQEQFDQQFQIKAQQILTPEQFDAFKTYQKAQRDLQTMGMNMAKQMYKP